MSCIHLKPEENGEKTKRERGPFPFWLFISFRKLLFCLLPTPPMNDEVIRVNYTVSSLYLSATADKSFLSFLTFPSFSLLQTNDKTDILRRVLFESDCVEVYLRPSDPRFINFAFFCHKWTARHSLKSLLAKMFRSPTWLVRIKAKLSRNLMRWSKPWAFARYTYNSLTLSFPTCIIGDI